MFLTLSQISWTRFPVGAGTREGRAVVLGSEEFEVDIDRNYYTHANNTRLYFLPHRSLSKHVNNW